MLKTLTYGASDTALISLENFRRFCMSDNRITIRLKDELRAKIRRLAQTQDKNPSEVIREAIIRHLAVVSGNNKSSAATIPR
jgi:hypothetical protein|tara:strand:- start:2405 stop:2650 length:246 start_codon:yes stop_codon:yes gene_type:complete